MLLNIFLGAGGRRRILDNGNLIINPIGRDDEGVYVCIAQNIYGTEESQGRLIVMRKYLLLGFNINFNFKNLFIIKSFLQVGPYLSSNLVLKSDQLLEMIYC